MTGIRKLKNSINYTYPIAQFANDNFLNVNIAFGENHHTFFLAIKQMKK